MDGYAGNEQTGKDVYVYDFHLRQRLLVIFCSPASLRVGFKTTVGFTQFVPILLQNQ